MIVVADTSPINYLAQLELVDLLSAIYGEVIITPAVLRELSHPNAPQVVRTFLEEKPEWLLLRRPIWLQSALLADLDEVEREAIQYAEEVHADLLLIDERKGWLAAGAAGLTSIGTLGILLQAGRLGLLDPASALLRLLSTTNFRLSTPQRADFLQRAASHRFLT